MVRRMTGKSLGLALALLVAGAAWAGVSDAWITTKAKIALLTADDVSVTAVNVDTVNGNVALHGKVKSEAEKERAEQAVRKVDGVKSVRNLLQVVPEAFEKTTKAADNVIKDRVEEALKADTTLGGVKVASVNNGVVLLSGETKTLDQKLRAIETVWKCDGVQRVASEVRVDEDAKS